MDYGSAAMNPRASKPVVISYAVFAAAMVLTGGLHLTTLLITVLFGCFALNKLTFYRKRWLAVVLFLLVVSVFFSGFAYFLRETIESLPKIASKCIPEVVQYADKHGIDLPFDDKDSLKEAILNALSQAKGMVGNFAKIATKPVSYTHLTLPTNREV